LFPTVTVNVSAFIYSALNLCVFTQNGKGLYLQTPSEFRQFSVSAHQPVRQACQIVIRDDARLPLAVSKTPGQRLTTTAVEDRSSHVNQTEAASPYVLCAFIAYTISSPTAARGNTVLQSTLQGFFFF
jgi:hypothetical protein